MGLDLLFVMPEVPYPPRKGTAMRNYNLVKHLSSRHRVRVIAFEGEQTSAQAMMEAGVCERVYTLPAPRRAVHRRLAQLVLPTPDLALRLESKAMVGKLTEVVRRDPPDIVQVEGLEMAPAWLHSRQNAAAPTQGRLFSILDEHNAEYAMQWRAFQADRKQFRHLPQALYSFLQWAKLRRYEGWVLSRFDGVVTVSAGDARALQQLPFGREAIVISNGVDTDYFSPNAAEVAVYTTEQASLSSLPEVHAARHALVFTGTLDYRPNVDAAIWMSREIMPLVRRGCPDANLYLIGQRPCPAVCRLDGLPGVHVLGPVEDVRPYMAVASVYVVPVRYGGGVRLKVLEAMAMGKPVVSTRMGLEGIELKPNVHALVADAASDFALAVVSLLRDEERSRELSRLARMLVCEKYDWRNLIPCLESYYDKLLADGRRKAAEGQASREV